MQQLKPCYVIIFIFIFIFIFLTTIGYAQKVLFLEIGQHFEPYTWNNDTLFFNKGGYDIIR